MTEESYKFRLACETGDLDLCKELFRDGVYDKIGFRSACEFGHVEIAMWILSVDDTINIHDR